MATTYKILGQSEPSDTNVADLYTVPSDTEAIVSTLVVANTSGTARTFRLFVREAGAAAGKENAIAYDTQISANSQVAFTLGLTLSATDILSVRSETANSITFQAFGSELT
jgi:hypothetical protein